MTPAQILVKLWPKLHAILYGLLHFPTPSKTVEKFLAATQAAVRG